MVVEEEEINLRKESKESKDVHRHRVLLLVLRLSCLPLVVEEKARVVAVREEGPVFNCRGEKDDPIQVAPSMVGEVVQLHPPVKGQVDHRLELLLIMVFIKL